MPGGGINRGDEMSRGQRAEAVGDIARTRRGVADTLVSARANGKQDERKQRRRGGRTG